MPLEMPDFWIGRPGRVTVIENIKSMTNAIKQSAFGILAALGLAACSSSSIVPDSNSVVGSVIRGTTAEPVVVDPSSLQPAQNCPKITVREGTQQIQQFSRGRQGEQEALEFQAIIDDAVRDCQYANGILTLNVGVRGRVLRGPAGSSFSGDLPVRIAIVKSGTNDVLYSNLRRTPASITPPQASTRFGFVENAISVQANPDDRSVLIYVGFDEYAQSASR